MWEKEKEGEIENEELSQREPLAVELLQNELFKTVQPTWFLFQPAVNNIFFSY